MSAEAHPAYRIGGEVASRDAFYAAACDPRRSVVVEACAGAGKTWMLVSRIVRALLEGAQPQEILAITFTRKAAGEMRERLAQWLEEWSAPHADDARRIRELRARGLDDRQAALLAPTLAGLHERLLASGRLVPIHTFHAWFSQLLRNAPLELLSELGLQPAMELVEDTSDLEPDVFRAFHTALLRQPSLKDDYVALVHRRGRAQVRKWLVAALERRVELALADAAGTLETSVPALHPEPIDHPAQVLHSASWRVALQGLADVLRGAGGVRCVDAADELESALAASQAIDTLARARRALFTKDANLDKQRPLKLGNVAGLADIQAHLDTISQQARDHEAHVEHARMVRLARVLLDEYAALKRRRGLADMADLEHCALHLLRDAELSAWVQERLDTQVRHLLIDEFQDTSPLQWQALHAWLSAYAGAGGGASGQRAPAVFIVGDPKQSIYRFRRAEPRVFDAAREFLCQAMEGRALACDHTRRNRPEVLAAVNAVFAAACAQGEFDGFRTHTTEVAPFSEGAAFALPAVDRPPRPARPAKGALVEPVWRDSLTVPREEPEQLLREHEARCVARAVAELIATRGVGPGEVMILSRRHAPLRLVADALQALHIPFVAAEDVPLMDAPVVRDLVALLDVLASPRHRLSLAHALRSPVFGASDDDLVWLARCAADASSEWLETILALALPADGAPESLLRAKSLLAAWLDAASRLPPHDVLDRILADGDVHARVAAAVPPERRRASLAAIDALIGLSLELDGGRYASPYGFVRALRRRALKAAGPADPDAVQLLTVHGAKGLESRVVFVVDSNPEPSNGDTATLLIDWPVEVSAPRRCAFIASEARVPTALTGLMARERAERRREELNGLYVAMTRARERLVFSQTPPVKAGARVGWWQRVAPTLAAWQPRPIDLSTARLGAIVLKRLPPYAPPVPAPACEATAAAADDAATRLGQAVHRILEWRSADAQVRPLADLAAHAAREFGLSREQAGDAARFAQAILDNPACARFMRDPDIRWSGAEVSIAVEGSVRRIDRLVQTASGEWWVLDFKLAAAPQDDPRNVRQLASYRDAVAALQPGAPVRAAFITGAGHVVELP